MRWFKIFGQETINDEGLCSLSDEEIGVWFRLISISSFQKKPGNIPETTLKQNYSWGKRRKRITEKIAKLGLIEISENGSISFPAFDLRQSDYVKYQKKSSKTLRRDLEESSKRLLNNEETNQTRVEENRKIDQSNDIGKVLTAFEKLTAMPPLQGYHPDEFDAVKDAISSLATDLTIERMINKMREIWINPPRGRKPGSLKYFMTVWINMRDEKLKEDFNDGIPEPGELRKISGRRI